MDITMYPRSHCIATEDSIIYLGRSGRDRGRWTGSIWTGWDTSGAMSQDVDDGWTVTVLHWRQSRRVSLDFEADEKSTHSNEQVTGFGRWRRRVWDRREVHGCELLREMQSSAKTIARVKRHQKTGVCLSHLWLRRKRRQKKRIDLIRMSVAFHVLIR